VKDTIRRLREAGLRTIMLTGDQRLTAEAIGRQLGLLESGDRVVDGRELDTLDQAALQERLDRVSAFSRVTPQHKLTIVSALQARGEIVAMLGDGVNDAPALKKADVGVAMGGRGTDVAKEAAAIVLQDDRFETIAAAVEEGRIIYENIRKFAWYLFSCNLGEVLVLLIAGVTGLPLPLLPLQILWLNIVTDTFPALALAMEPGDPGIMQRPPRRPDDALLSRAFMTQVLVYAALITAATLGAFLWALSHDARQANTVGFMALGLAQIFHLGNARGDAAMLGPRRMFSNRYAVAAVIGSVAVQLAAVQLGGLRQILGLTPLTSAGWIVVAVAALLPAVVGQIHKSLDEWRRAQRSRV
jgi:P-type Ca2+ transporter type 2C